MKRTTLTLLALVAAIAIWTGTTQAAPAVSINAGLASQTLARHHGGGHHGAKHHAPSRHRGHHGYHYRPRHHYRHMYYPPVYVAPPVYYGGYGYGRGGFYINGNNFSFGIGY